MDKLSMRPGAVVPFDPSKDGWPIGRAIPGLCNDFPIRPDFMAQVVIPRDMTMTEAKRLCAFIMAMGLPDSASERD